uniref:Receptor kinase-like protein Xa21 n=1 Tax=Oryza barthii TaxID=65489 RepID=A0A0D3GI51_9ORYZ
MYFGFTTSYALETQKLFKTAALLSNAPSTTDASMLKAPTANTASNSSDRQVLLSFKSLITKDPSGALTSWGNRSLHHCRWQGVMCGKRGRRRGRVIAIDLNNLGLVGSISPSISNLTYLRKLHLPQNQFGGHIPHELGLLDHLKFLNLSINSLEGEIPTSLSQCSRLQTISLWYNNLQGRIPSNLSHCSYLRTIEVFANYLEGEIPSELGSLQRLELLNLYNNNLTGSIPSYIGNLKNLILIDISDNGLTGSIPPEIGNLQNLQFMDFGKNKLSGSIPASLGNLFSLNWLDLGNNSLVGTIPPSLGGLPYLSTFILARNKLVGNIPPSLGNLSSLTELNFARNNLTGIIPHSLGNIYGLNSLRFTENMLTGTIPSSLGKLINLVYIGLQFNNLIGEIPLSLFNLSSLQKLDLQNNKFSGSLQNYFGDKFPLLQGLALNGNKFHGLIPLSLSNCSMLELIQLDNNSFSGTNLGNLKRLSKLRLDYNKLEANYNSDWDFMNALTNCTQLQVLQLSFNRLRGVLPHSLSNLSTSLEHLAILNNEVGGNIPEGIGRLSNLMALYMGPNLLTGSIPASLGKLSKLNVISLAQNRLSGEIPPTLGNLTQLSELYLSMNAFTGEIPSALGKCPLGVLALAYNKLSGNIPKEIFSSSRLRSISLLSNMLVGPMPSELGLLKNLQGLDFSQNKLTGEIPISIGGCQSLEFLLVSQNFIHGSIPSTMNKLTGLQELDLSSNNISGIIPMFLGSFIGLTYLNLSFNNLIGEVPDDGIFRNATAFSIVGNVGLCGGIPVLSLPSCTNQQARKHKFPKLAVAMSVSITYLFLVISIGLISVLCKKHKSSSGQTSTRAVRNQLPRVSYTELSMGTNGFSSSNLIGEGRFGSVYKANMSFDQYSVVAVKVLKLQERGASHSFLAECEALRYLRHRNLVKILTACSSIDPRGHDFKALIFEYLPNGSLDKWLHTHIDEQSDQSVLNIYQKLSIATDVGSAVEYLHDYKPVPIVHCDLKPSNILLDSDMMAHVGDFGLARFTNQGDNNASQVSSSWAAFRGTIGYAAPEYGIGNEVTTSGDVYSYGIILLEMFTGRRPTEQNFEENADLHRFVEEALPDSVEDVVDQNLILPREDTEMDHNTLLNKEAALACITSILRVGILCSKQLPTERVQIRDAVRELHKIKEKFFP